MCDYYYSDSGHSESESDSDTDATDTTDTTLCEFCFRLSYGVFREGYNVCEKCGNIKETCNIDQTGEWNNYTKTDGSGQTDNSRCGFTDTNVFKTSDLSTSVKGYSRIAQMSKWGSISHKDADAYYMKEAYTSIANVVGFSYTVVSKACKLYREVTENNITRQNVRDGIKAAALFQALSSESGYSYTISDVARWFGITSQSASAGNSTITSFLYRGGTGNDSNADASGSGTTGSVASDIPLQSVQITKASDIVERFGNLFQFPYPLRLKTQKFCESMQKRNEFYGTHGSSLAAGVIYYFIKESTTTTTDNIHINDIGIRTDVSPGTIKKVYNTLQKIVNARNAKKNKTKQN